MGNTTRLKRPATEHSMSTQTFDILQQLRAYLNSDEPAWLQAQELAERQNAWFTGEFIREAIRAIVQGYLNEQSLNAFATKYPPLHSPGKGVGIVMAGNIPMVGFHDLLCGILSGHTLYLKLSSKDEVLMRHIVQQLHAWSPELQNRIRISDMLKGLDAYIATGSKQSAGYFRYYFGKYPSLIRRNRTSIAILDGSESEVELLALADDVHRYFGLGCRNVTKLYVPEGYRFEPMMQTFRAYERLKDHNKYRNNLDYQLALYILNGQFYMSNESLLLLENGSLFSPVSVLHYEYYANRETLETGLWEHEDIQAIAGKGHIPFGQLQTPELEDFADGVNTMSFLLSL